MTDRYSLRRIYALLVVAATVVSASATLAARTPPAKPQEQVLQIVLRGDTIASPSPTSVNGKRYITVQKGVRIKLTVKSEDKAYTFEIVGKSGTAVTVEKNAVSSPVYFSCSDAGEEHAIKITTGGTQVGTGLYLRAE